jgi:hypothetical protein
MNTWLKERYFLPDATQLERSGLGACFKVSCFPPPRSSFILQALSCLVDLVLTSDMSPASLNKNSSNLALAPPAPMKSLLQLLSHYLQTSLRLNPTDITVSLEVLDFAVGRWHRIG